MPLVASPMQSRLGSLSRTVTTVSDMSESKMNVVQGGMQRNVRGSAPPDGRSTTTSTVSASSVASSVPPIGERGHNDFVLLFNRSNGFGRVHYLMVEQGRRSHILPKLCTLDMPKLQDTIGYSVVVLDNLVYVLGGYHLAAAVCLGHCYCLNPVNNRWQRKASLLKARCRFSATALDGFIYVCGGEGRGGHVLDALECYDPVTDTWTSLQRLPGPRADHAACAASHRLYVTGGQDHRQGGTSTFWQYDPQSDYWSQAGNGTSLPRSVSNHLMAAYRGRLHVCGGSKLVYKETKMERVEDGTVWCFDCGRVNMETRLAGDWAGLPPMNTPRILAATVVLGHNIYVIGGFNVEDDQPVNMVEYYNVRKKKWCEAFSLGEGNFTDIAAVLVRVPTTNRDFSTAPLVMRQKSWVLW